MPEIYGGRRRYLGQPPGGGGAVHPEYYVYPVDFAGGTVLAAGIANARPTALAFASAAFRINSDANFQFQKTMYVATDPRVYVRYRDETANRYLQRGTMDLAAIAGIAAPMPFVNAAPNPRLPSFIPYVWEEPHVIAAASVFTVEAADFSGAQNTVRLAFHGSSLREGPAPWDRPGARRLKYSIAVPPDDQTPVIAANATVTVGAPVDNDADFVVYKITGRRTGACMVSLQDGRDRQWFASPVHIDNLIGSGGFPNILPAPRFVPRGSAITGTIQELSGAENIVSLFMHGVKLYDA